MRQKKASLRPVADVFAILTLGAVLSSASLALPSAARAAETDWAKARPVTVVMTEYKFTPDHLRFERGVPYRLHLENRGKEVHEFTAPTFFKTIRLHNPNVLSPASGDVVLSPGQQKDVYFIAERPGRYDLTCADHDWDGMIGSIVVD